MKLRASGRYVPSEKASPSHGMMLACWKNVEKKRAYISSSHGIPHKTGTLRMSTGFSSPRTVPCCFALTNRLVGAPPRCLPIIRAILLWLIEPDFLEGRSVTAPPLVLPCVYLGQRGSAARTFVVV